MVLEGLANVIVRRGGASITLQPGAVFGDMALLDGSPRSAWVVADSELVVFRLGRPQFLKLLRGEPTVALALLQTLAGRLRALQGA